MKTIAFLTCIFSLHFSIAQSLLNGSFEDNSLSYNTSFHYDFTSNSFSSSINNAYGISESDTLMLGMKKNLAYEGNWSLVMYKQLGLLNANTYDDDYVSLKLSEPLVQGQMYSIGFYIKKYNIYQFPNIGGPDGNQPIGVVIGYASDSTSGGVEIFQSEEPTSFDEWQYQSVQFKCFHTNINYITIGLNEPFICGPRYICQVVHFNFSTVTNIGEFEQINSLYPNPTQGIVHLQHPLASEVVLHDLMGKEQFRQTLTKKENSLNIEHLPRGIYLLSLWHEGQQLQQEKLFKIR